MMSGRYLGKASVRILGEKSVKIPAGGTARLRVKLPAVPFLGQIQLELSEPPDGIVIQRVSPSGEGTEVVLQSDAAKVKPGLKGNLIVAAFSERNQTFGQGKAKTAKQRTRIDTLPAIAFEIVER